MHEWYLCSITKHLINTSIRPTVLAIKNNHIVALSIILDNDSIANGKFHSLINQIEIMKSFASSSVCKTNRILVFGLSSLDSLISIANLDSRMSYLNGIVNRMIRFWIGLWIKCDNVSTNMITKWFTCIYWQRHTNAQH